MRLDDPAGLPNWRTLTGIVSLTWTPLLPAAEVDCTVPTAPPRSIATGLPAGPEQLEKVGRVRRGAWSRTLAAPAGQAKIVSQDEALVSAADPTMLFDLEPSWRISDFSALKEEASTILNQHQLPIDAESQGEALWTWRGGSLFSCKRPADPGALTSQQAPLFHTLSAFSNEHRFQTRWPEDSAFAWAFGVWNCLTVLDALDHEAFAQWDERTLRRDQMIWSLRGHLDRFIKPKIADAGGAGTKINSTNIMTIRHNIIKSIYSSGPPEGINQWSRSCKELSAEIYQKYPKSIEAVAALGVHVTDWDSLDRRGASLRGSTGVKNARTIEEELRRMGAKKLGWY